MANDQVHSLEDIERLGVYQVYTGTGTGSGFLIDQTHLLTNCHVVQPYREVAVEMRDKSRIIGRVRRVHPHRDLAIVELSRPVDGEVLALSDGEQLRTKQPVHILGFPVGLPLSLTEGVISHVRQLLDEQYFLQTDAAINPGNSGGPMLDDQRRIIAVTTCKLNAADAVGFGIPVADVRQFIDEFRAQQVAFGVQCPTCQELIDRAVRYCPSCGSDLETHHDFGEYFETPELHPLSAFVESALAASNIDPVLARHGSHNWSFHVGSAPVKIWACCSEHLNFSSPMAQTPNKGLNELFRYLLSAEHAPYAFDLVGSTVRLNLVVHISDVFAPSEHAHLVERVRGFIAKADATDNLLIREYGCQPAPETQMDVLKGEHRAEG
ncbi:MAG: trypsin-like peptidase domain-containing protein [Rhodanobacteraceae bacterium]|nr:trypsin-like peptidase domain-containing protein [Rhodanobacteraceae bacterium]